MIIEFIQSYIWCSKNAPQGGRGFDEEKANHQVVDIWPLLRNRNFYFGALFENITDNDEIQDFVLAQANQGKGTALLN